MNPSSSPDESEFLHTLFDRIAVAIYGIRDGRFTFVNGRLAELLGYTREEILAFDSAARVMPVDQEGSRELARRQAAVETGELRCFTTVRHSDGRLLDVEVHESVTDLAGDRILIGAVVDVTSQVASNRTIHEREEYFHALTENIRDVIAIVDAAGVLSYLSPSLETSLGYRPAQLLGTVAFGCVHPDDRERLSEALAELVPGGSFGPAEYRVQHRNGSWRVAEVAGTNLLHHPQIRGLVINLRDITDRRRMEQEVAQLQRLTSLGRLAAQVAHEFNNVLMGIQPMIDVLRRGTEDPVAIRQIDVIGASLSRGKRITTDILRYGRPAQLTARPVKAGEILRKAVEEIRPMLRDDVKLELEHSETPLVLGDPAQLAQVFMNLALNAQDAMAAEGTLTMGASLAETGAAQPFVHFRVADTGSGISAEDLPYIFEPLFTTKKTGTGLGLSVVYQIVTLHGGHISVESKPGQGTTFDVFVPAVPAQQHEGKEEADVSDGSDCRRILLVEDEEMIALGLRMTLEAHGLEVEVAATGAAVVPAIEAFQPDVVVLDLSLPDADGRNVYAEISRRFALPVVFSSGHAAEWEIEELLVPGRTAFLMKPYSTDDLLSTIRILLNTRAAESS